MLLLLLGFFFFGGGGSFCFCFVFCYVTPYNNGGETEIGRVRHVIGDSTSTTSVIGDLIGFYMDLLGEVNGRGALCLYVN